MNANVYCERQGEGIPLVLLHGWGFHGGIWQPLIEKLSQYFSLWIIDIPGFGYSEWPTSESYTFERVLEKIAEVTPSSAYWLGWSMGGLCTLAMALRAPERVRGLIQVASSPCFLTQNQWPGMNVNQVEQFRTQLSENYRRTLRHFITLQWVNPLQDRCILRELEKILFERPIPSQEILQTSLKWLSALDFRTSTSAIMCPIWYGLGRLDTLVPLALRDELPTVFSHGECVTFTRSAHMPFLSEKDHFITEIYEFVSRCNDRK